MSSPLDQVQSTVWAHQQGLLHLTHTQMPRFSSIRQTVYATRLSVLVEPFAQVAELLAAPMASEEVHEVLMVCGGRILDLDPALLNHRVSFFYEEFAGG